LLEFLFHFFSFSLFVGGYPKNSDNYPNTSGVLNTFKYTVRACRMDLPGPTTSVGTRTDYSVGPWDYPTCATRHLKAWSTRTAQE
jgi:hypothetical protein